MAETFNPVLTANLSNQQSITAAIDTNFAALATLLQDVLSRTAVAPNQMQAALDVNSQQILNVRSPVAPTDLVRLIDVNSLMAGGALASLISFTPTGNISSTNVQTAIAEVDTEKAAISSLANVAFSGAGADMLTNGVAWTPTLTFAVPGDLAVTYTSRVGRYYQLATSLVLVQFTVATTSFTFTTASGNLQVTGLPFSQGAPGGVLSRGATTWGGITKAGYTQITPVVAAATPNIITYNGNGSGVAPSTVTAADTPSGGQITLTTEIIVLIT